MVGTYGVDELYHLLVRNAKMPKVSKVMYKTFIINVHCTVIVSFASGEKTLFQVPTSP